MNGELRVENLKYNDILKDINLNIKEGTINVLMGNNGSGKTLLFKCILGLVNADGLVIYNGDIITNDNLNIIRKNFGIYLGLNNLEDKSAFLNIIEPLNYLNCDIEKSKKMVYEISKKLGIEKFLYKNISSLSHSEKKMISFIQSIIHEPKVIIIDGLFDSLDVYYKNKIINYLKFLKKSKKCIIIFTTNNSEDLWIADNLIIIKNGKVLINDNVYKLIQDENLFHKNNIKLPFVIDLSYKLQIYDLIDKLIYSIDEVVDEIW